MEDSLIQTVIDILRDSNNIVFFGGAGVSTASGIPDFRSKNGIYRKKSYGKGANESMLTHQYFMNNIESYLIKYRSSLLGVPKYPNPAHQCLVKLEQMGKLKTVITQNVDGLHQMAGSSDVIELHGNHGTQYCMECGQKYNKEWYLKEEGIRYCEVCGGLVRPNMVLFGEKLRDNSFERAVAAVQAAEVFLIGGSSLAVSPAAGLLRRYTGDKMILINEEPTKRDNKMDYVIRGDISKILPHMVEAITTQDRSYPALPDSCAQRLRECPL